MRNGYRLAITMLFVASAASALAQGDARRGEYVAKVGGCVGCHTEDKESAQPFAGGRALKTPFGTFYGPNITPDPNAGLGGWSEGDFIRAMRFGERPDGANYFPAFPYTSFTKATDGDLKDLWAYLRTLKPSAQPSRLHDVRFPYSWRWLVTIWKWFFFTPGPYVAPANASAMLARGGYLVDALGHCGECHTPRNFLGAMKKDRWLAGGKGPDDKTIPNLTPTRLKKQSDAELKDFLVTGTTPDGDAPAEAMAEVIRNTTSQLAPADLDALIAYLRSLPPLPEEKRDEKE